MGVKKDIQYKNEQEIIIDKLLTILDLHKNNNFILYEVDHNKNKLNEINNLLDDIKKIFFI